MAGDRHRDRGAALRPTPRGWVVLLGGVALAGAGVTLGYRELVILGGTALTLFVLALALTGRLRPTEVRRTVGTTRMAPGAEAEVRVTVRHSGRGRPAQVLADQVRGPAGAQRVELPPIRPGKESDTGYRLRAERRGVLDLGPVEVRRVDPLALVAARHPSGGTERVWVHPPWQPLGSMPLGQTDDPQGTFDGRRAGSVSFHSLREYVPGDDVRHIHWRSTARHGTLMVREYVDTTHTRMTVLADDRAGSAGDALAALDEVAGAAASVAAAAVHARWTCEVHLASGRRRDTVRELAPLLDLLAEAVVEPRASLPDALWRLRNRPSGDVTVLVSATVTTAEARLFARLRDRCPRLVLVSLRPYGAPIGPLPGVTVLNARTAVEAAARWNGERWVA